MVDHVRAHVATGSAECILSADEISELRDQLVSFLAAAMLQARALRGLVSNVQASAFFKKVQCVVCAHACCRVVLERGQSLLASALQC